MHLKKQPKLILGFHLLVSSFFLLNHFANAEVPEEGGLIVYKEQSYYPDTMDGAIVYRKCIPRGPQGTIYFGITGGSVIIPDGGIIEIFDPSDLNVRSPLNPELIKIYNTSISRLENIAKRSQKIKSVVLPVAEEIRSRLASAKLQTNQSSIAGMSTTSTNSVQVGQPVGSPNGSLSGSISLEKSVSSSVEGQLKEVLATGIGADAASAEKQALITAVQQAVGSYLDTKTITENEQVIKDRILSLSNGFVSKYDVISGPKQRDDKLFEVTIKAMVQGGQVVAKLKEVNLVKGEVAGQNLYAQNLTQMLSAEDARKMLNEKLPELVVNCMKMEFVDKDGNPRPNSDPVDQIRDDQAQTVKCTWYIKLTVDNKIYGEQMLPLLRKCLNVMLEAKPVKFAAKVDKMSPPSDKDYNSLHRMHFAIEFPEPHDGVVVVNSISRNGDYLEGLYYQDSKYNIDTKIRQMDDLDYGSLCFTLKSSNGDIISQQVCKMQGSSRHHMNQGAQCSNWDEGLSPFVSGDPNNCYLTTFSPFIYSETCRYKITGHAVVVEPISVEIPVNDLKDLSKVDVQVLPPTYDFILKPNPNWR